MKKIVIHLFFFCSIINAIYGNKWMYVRSAMAASIYAQLSNSIVSLKESIGIGILAELVAETVGRSSVVSDKTKKWKMLIYKFGIPTAFFLLWGKKAYSVITNEEKRNNIKEYPKKILNFFKKKNDKKEDIPNEEGIPDNEAVKGQKEVVNQRFDQVVLKDDQFKNITWEKFQSFIKFIDFSEKLNKEFIDFMNNWKFYKKEKGKEKNAPGETGIDNVVEQLIEKGFNDSDYGKIFIQSLNNTVKIGDFFLLLQTYLATCLQKKAINFFNDQFVETLNNVSIQREKNNDFDKGFKALFRSLLDLRKYQLQQRIDEKNKQDNNQQIKKNE